MPRVMTDSGLKKYPYTPAGKAAARKARAQMGKKGPRSVTVKVKARFGKEV